VQAFERAVAVPDANIHDLLLGAARVARVIADGGAQRPEEYASIVLRRIAWQSRRNFLDQPQTCPLVEEHEDIKSPEEEFNGPSAILAKIGIRQLIESLNERDQKIVLMRSRGFRYEEIAQEAGMLLVSVLCRYHLAKKRLQKLAADKR
jgi:DNA-directed RNA polymerase specialized sigma24 family protein